MNPSSWNFSFLNPFRSSSESSGLENTIWTSESLEMGWKNKKFTPEGVQSFIANDFCLGKTNEKENEDFLKCLKKFYLENPDPRTDINGAVMNTIIDILLDNNYSIKSNVEKSMLAMRLLTRILTLSPPSISEIWEEKRQIFGGIQESVDTQLKLHPQKSTKMYDKLINLRTITFELENKLENDKAGISYAENQNSSSHPNPKDFDAGQQSVPTRSVGELYNSCNRCFHTAKSGLELIHLTCGHVYCNRCLLTIVRKTIQNNSSNVVCHVDGILITREIIVSLLSEDEKQLYRKLVQWKSEHKFVEGEFSDKMTPCPKCKTKILPETSSPGFPKFGECSKCDYTFCCDCYKDFHGGSLCQYYQNTILAESDVNKSGALLKKHELDFYSQNMETKENEAELYYTPEEINIAFVMTKLIEPNEEPYPWDSTDFDKFHRFPAPYESLNEGNWVDDEILEKCMKNLVEEKSSSSGSICILESYAMNWAAQKNYKDGNLLNLVMEKNILHHATVAALMNTDLRGSGGHWILGTVNTIQKQIIIFDTSVVLSPTFYQKYFFYLLHIRHVAHQLNGSVLDPKAWKLIISLDSIQQNNANDCGPFVVANLYGVINRRQVSTRPNGLKVRKWIHNVIESSNLKSIDNDTMSTQPHAREQIVQDIPDFMPSGLKYTYEVTQDIISNAQISSEPLVSLI